MDSSELYHVKQQFFLGAYHSLAEQPLPDPASPDYTPILVYKARAQIALDRPDLAAQLVPADTESVALRAVSALARFAAAPAGERDAALEELRDLCVEIEGDDGDADARERGAVRVLAGTAFARAGEVEEALETLGAGTTTENLEAVALTVHIYLSLSRADLARKELDRAKRWAEDDLLLQLIEASIGLAAGRDGYADADAFYTEQLANPSLSSPHLLTARGVTRLLRGEIAGAKSDFEEAVAQRGGAPDAETLAGMAVAAGLGTAKHAEADQLFSQLATAHPTHPMVVDVGRKAEQFDELCARFVVPPLPAAAAAA
ncbi:hypothetical protein WOLCODRAFT_140287 [Wolfiporia cocos MD-104 SS10]|uniref:Coatomer subunit epsilon n=1 Tax=Wolfiporia cocos (strain MD-104) TaxID=742152 RepID=A0A2H3J3H3_WOLCO|nr:hypothetical protein WOLCODRAFT_140287 [Wolfiporia cocos MD-104 SS10]